MPLFRRTVTVLSFVLCPPLVAQDTTAYRVQSIRVLLFHETYGMIDTTDLVALGERANLFNTNIGGGLADDSPSGAAVVLVELTGPFHLDETGHMSGPFANDTNHSVLLRAQLDGRTVLERTVRLRSLFSEERQVWVPFIVYGTGCGVLKLNATLTRDRQPEATLLRTINFQCGE